MTEVSAASSTAGSSSQAASRSLIGNYDLFLSILTTQIQNQDPLDPLDSAEYTSQLVQYSSVEQAIQTNTHLEQLLATMQKTQASSYVNYLGSEVTAAGGTTMLTDGDPAKWHYSLAESASGTVEISNSAGAVVFSDEISLAAGSNTYYWDGVSSSGVNSPDGAYTISFNLKDANGKAEGVSIEVSGIVDEVDLSTGTPFLKIGDVRVPISAVKRVSDAG